MPGLYGITSNANISVYNTTGLYNVGNANIALQGNVTVSNTLGLYQALGNPVILTNAQQLFNLLDETGNVQFQLTNSNTTVQAFTANIGTPAGTFGSNTAVAQITTTADGRIQAVQNVPIDFSTYAGNLNVNILQANTVGVSGNVTANGYFVGNGAFLTGLPSSNIYLVGDVSGTGTTGSNLTTTLSNTGVVGGLYGDDIRIPQITVDAKGRVTNIANVVIAGGGSGTYGNANVSAFLPTYGGAIDATDIFNVGQVNLSSSNFVQMQLSTGTLPANPYSLGTGSWVFLDDTGFYFDSNITGTQHSFNISNEGNVFVDNRILVGNGIYWYGNGQIYGGTYSNANVQAYLPSDPTIIAINSNVAATNANVAAANAQISTLQTQVYSNANVAAYLPINSANVAGQFFLGNAFYMTGVGAITYSNANVTAYLPLDPTIIAINSNVSILQSNIGIPTVYANIATIDTNWVVLQTSNASYYTYTIDASGNSWANSASSVNNLTVLNGNVVNGNVISVTYNVGPPDYYTLRFLINRTTYPWLATTGANSLPSGGGYAGWYANSQVAMYASNATVQALSINSIDANVTAANNAIASVNANVTAANSAISTLQTNAATQATQINSLNANVAAANVNIGRLNSNVTAANTNIQSISANLGAYQIYSNANLVFNSISINRLYNDLTNTANVITIGSNWPTLVGNNSGYYTYTLTGGSSSSNAVAFSANNIVNILAGNGYPMTVQVSNVRYVAGSYTTTFVVDRAAYPWYDALGPTAFFAGASTTANAVVYGISNSANIAIDQINANVAAANVNITTLFSNAAVQSLAINSINANVSAANASIAAINANVTAANTNIQTLSANVGAYQIWANGAIASANYSNANVASYLPVYGGNIFVSNITGGNVSFDTYRIAFPGNQVIVNSAAIFGGIILFDNVVSATKRVDAGNLVVNYNSTFGGNVSVQNGGNVIVDVPGYFIGDGSKLTNINAGNIIGSYGNANVAAYLPTDPTIQAIQANVSAANSAIATLDANIGAFETYTNLTFQTFSANSGAYQVWANGAISAVNANVAAANVNIADLYTKVYSNANVAAYMPLYLPTYSGDIGNLTVQGNLTVNGTTTSINYNEYVAGLLVANSTTAATSTTSGALQVKGGAGVVGNVVAGAFYSDLHLYANGQPYAGTYSNANVASYLPVYGGIINVLNITGVAGQNIAIEPDGTGDILLQADTIQIGDNNQDVTIASRGTGNITLRTHFNNGDEGNITLVHGANGNIILWPNGTGTVQVQDSLHATGNVYASYYHGDGSQLTNLPTQTGTYSNVNVAAYIPTDPTITSIQANVTAANAAIATLDANIGAYETWANGRISTLDANLGTVSTEIIAIQANVSAANSAIATLSANVGAFETYANTEFGTFSANLGAYQTYTNTAIQTLDANVGAYETWANLEFSTISANVGAYQIWANNAIGTIDANLGAFQVYSNTRIGTLEANLGAFETYANNTFSTSTYSNVNVAAYIPTDPTITAIQANITAANAAIATLDANVGAYQIWANGAISTLDANVGAFETYANLEFGTISANLGAYQTWANGRIGTLDANIGAFETYANTTFATITSLQTLDANVGAFETYANLEFGSINANLGAFQTYANSTFGASTYSNANVAAYLLTNTGNISADYFLGNGYFLTGISTGGSTYGNANVAAYLPTDATIQGINANVAAANTRIQTLDANIGAYETWANGYFASTSSLNSYTLLSTFNVLDANVGAYETWANGRISTLDANIGTLFLGNISTQANLGAFQTYANATFYKSGSTITAANVISTNGYFWSNGVAYSTGGGSYGNTQVAAYLPIYGGNISAANMYATSANVTGLMFFGSSYKETVYAFGTTSGTLTVNVANGTIQTVTVNGNITINTNNFTNMGPGQSVTVVIVQDATGGRTLTSNVLFAGNAKTLTNAASAVDTLSVFYDGTRYLGALVKGYV